jgi:prepilin-type N-terminal cleavage/methylation domain-containing protein
MAAYHSITARRRQSSRGFTLIELLVVIAIIGLLASVIIASLGSARAKGRDARRLADLRSMANQIELQRTGVTSYAFVGCTGADVRASTCTTPGLQAYKDPSGVTTACTSASTASCDYSVSQAGGLN